MQQHTHTQILRLGHSEKTNSFVRQANNTRRKKDGWMKKHSKRKRGHMYMCAQKEVVLLPNCERKMIFGLGTRLTPGALLLGTRLTPG